MKDLAMSDLLKLVELKLDEPEKYKTFLDNVGIVMKDFLVVAMDAASELQKEIMEKQAAAMKEAKENMPEEAEDVCDATEEDEGKCDAPVDEEADAPVADETDTAEAEKEAEAEPEAEAEKEAEAEPEAEAEKEAEAEPEAEAEEKDVPGETA